MFAHGPKSCQIRQNLGQTLRNPHISETAGWIYTIWNSMELSRPVVVQQHRHLSLTLDFQGQILKMLYLRNGRANWHGIKRKWVDRLLDSHCDFVLWPWIFKVSFWNSCISGMGGPINIEWKGYESIGCYNTMWPWAMTLTFDFEGQILKKLYHRNKRVDWHGTKRMWVSIMLDVMTLKLWPHPWTWPSLFRVKLLIALL